ncbi:hypothetical protein, partial [Salmonella enterica]|uniref:hypothetical protein n=1 Tax=Salmonella enterica TaxID=28901 RepID=UPI0020C2B9A4
MNTLANSLPTETSWFDKWFGSGGKMSVETFGEQLESFGKAIVSFSKSVSGTIDTTTITTSVTVVSDLI